MSENVSVNTTGLLAHPSRCANWYPIVRGVCTSCGLKSLFLAYGGFVTCANLSCGNPTAVADALENRAVS
jgi:hypothetical protein